MENEQINFSFSEIQHSRPRKTSISSYTSYTSYTSNYFPKGISNYDIINFLLFFI